MPLFGSTFVTHVCRLRCLRYTRSRLPFCCSARLFSYVLRCSLLPFRLVRCYVRSRTLQFTFAATFTIRISLRLRFWLRFYALPCRYGLPLPEFTFVYCVYTLRVCSFVDLRLRSFVTHHAFTLFRLHFLCTRLLPRTVLRLLLIVAFRLRLRLRCLRTFTLPALHHVYARLHCLRLLNTFGAFTFLTLLFTFYVTVATFDSGYALHARLRLRLICC